MKDDAAEILALEQQRCQAEIEGDSAALERLLDDGLVHIHTGGTIDGKKTLIASRKSLKFLAMSRRDLQVRVGGDLAVLTGGISFQVQRVGSSNVIGSDAFVTQVLVRRGGGWKFILYQGTTLKI